MLSFYAYVSGKVCCNLWMIVVFARALLGFLPTPPETPCGIPAHIFKYLEILRCANRPTGLSNCYHSHTRIFDPSHYLNTSMV